MKLNIRAFAVSQTVAAALLYVVCSFFVGFLPTTAISFARSAFHADLAGNMRPFSVSGFFVFGGLLVLRWNPIYPGIAALFFAALATGVCRPNASREPVRRAAMKGAQ